MAHAATARRGRRELGNSRATAGASAKINFWQNSALCGSSAIPHRQASTARSPLSRCCADMALVSRHRHLPRCRSTASRRRTPTHPALSYARHHHLRLRWAPLPAIISTAAHLPHLMGHLNLMQRGTGISCRHLHCHTAHTSGLPPAYMPAFLADIAHLFAVAHTRAHAPPRAAAHAQHACGSNALPPHAPASLLCSSLGMPPHSMADSTANREAFILRWLGRGMSPMGRCSIAHAQAARGEEPSAAGTAPARAAARKARYRGASPPR